jgi:NADH-quinone oxidoreductase subunit M
MVPFHSWIPDFYSEAPSGGSIVLFTLMIKLGAYGFLRFLLPLIPAVTITITLGYVLIGISLVTIIYAGIISIAQIDFKKLIAYSSISHMGLIILALSVVVFLVPHKLSYESNFISADMAIQGAVFQMITHAFSSGGMFIGCSFLYSRMQTKMISDFQGVAKSMPIFSTFFMLFALTNIGLPGTSGFVGEFLMILALFKYLPWIALSAGLTLILSPVYTLWMYRRIFFGNVISKKVAELKDVSGIEVIVLTLLAIPALLFGLYPKIILQLSEPAIMNIIQAVHTMQ